jgi:hypothetical protein
VTPDPDLSSAFGTSATAQRREQLGGLLPRRTASPPQPAAELAPAAPTMSMPASSPPLPTAPASAKTSAPPATAAAGQETMPVSVYVQPAVVEAARRYRRKHRGTSHADIALDAIEARRDDLAALVTQRHSTTVRAAGELFPARGSRRRRRDGTPRVLWTIFLTAAEIQVIDRLTTETGAASRSELISVAVEAEMG